MSEALMYNFFKTSNQRKKLHFDRTDKNLWYNFCSSFFPYSHFGAYLIPPKTPPPPHQHPKQRPLLPLALKKENNLPNQQWKRKNNCHHTYQENKNNKSTQHRQTKTSLSNKTGKLKPPSSLSSQNWTCNLPPLATCPLVFLTLIWYEIRFSNLRERMLIMVYILSCLYKERRERRERFAKQWWERVVRELKKSYLRRNNLIIKKKKK